MHEAPEAEQSKAGKLYLHAEPQLLTSSTGPRRPRSRLGRRRPRGGRRPLGLDLPQLRHDSTPIWRKEGNLAAARRRDQLDDLGAVCLQVSGRGGGRQVAMTLRQGGGGGGGGQKVREVYRRVVGHG